MIGYLIAGSFAGATAWCWVKLIAPWARAHGVHEELLEIQREMVVPTGCPWSQEIPNVQGLANLATAISFRSGNVRSDASDLQVIAQLPDLTNCRERNGTHPYFCHYCRPHDIQTHPVYAEALVQSWKQWRTHRAGVQGKQSVC